MRKEEASRSLKIDYVFLCCVSVWHDILFQINIASQAFQSMTSNVQTATLTLENLLAFLQNYEKNGLIRLKKQMKWLFLLKLSQNLIMITEGRRQLDNIEIYLKYSKMTLFPKNDTYH